MAWHINLWLLLPLRGAVGLSSFVRARHERPLGPALNRGLRIALCGDRGDKTGGERERS
jgi:hypothetical protein